MMEDVKNASYNVSVSRSNNIVSNDLSDSIDTNLSGNILSDPLKRFAKNCCTNSLSGINIINNSCGDLFPNNSYSIFDDAHNPTGINDKHKTKVEHFFSRSSDVQSSSCNIMYNNNNSNSVLNNCNNISSNASRVLQNCNEDIVNSSFSMPLMQTTQFPSSSKHPHPLCSDSCSSSQSGCSQVNDNSMFNSKKNIDSSYQFPNTSKNIRPGEGNYNQCLFNSRSEHMYSNNNNKHFTRNNSDISTPSYMNFVKCNSNNYFGSSNDIQCSRSNENINKYCFRSNSSLGTFIDHREYSGANSTNHVRSHSSIEICSNYNYDLPNNANTYITHNDNNRQSALSNSTDHSYNKNASCINNSNYDCSLNHSCMQYSPTSSTRDFASSNRRNATDNLSQISNDRNVELQIYRTKEARSNDNPINQNDLIHENPICTSTSNKMCIDAEKYNHTESNITALSSNLNIRQSVITNYEHLDSHNNKRTIERNIDLTNSSNITSSVDNNNLWLNLDNYDHSNSSSEVSSNSKNNTCSSNKNEVKRHVIHSDSSIGAPTITSYSRNEIQNSSDHCYNNKIEMFSNYENCTRSSGTVNANGCIDNVSNQHFNRSLSSIEIHSLLSNENESNKIIRKKKPFIRSSSSIGAPINGNNNIRTNCNNNRSHSSIGAPMSSFCYNSISNGDLNNYNDRISIHGSHRKEMHSKDASIRQATNTSNLFHSTMSAGSCTTNIKDTCIVKTNDNCSHSSNAIGSDANKKLFDNDRIDNITCSINDYQKTSHVSNRNRMRSKSSIGVYSSNIDAFGKNNINFHRSQSSNGSYNYTDNELNCSGINNNHISGMNINSSSIDDKDTDRCNDLYINSTNYLSNTNQREIRNDCSIGTSGCSSNKDNFYSSINNSGNEHYKVGREVSKQNNFTSPNNNSQNNGINYMPNSSNMGIASNRGEPSLYSNNINGDEGNDVFSDDRNSYCVESHNSCSNNRTRSQSSILIGSHNKIDTPYRSRNNKRSHSSNDVFIKISKDLPQTSKNDPHSIINYTNNFSMKNISRNDVQSSCSDTLSDEIEDKNNSSTLNENSNDIYSNSSTDIRSSSCNEISAILSNSYNYFHDNSCHEQYTNNDRILNNTPNNIISGPIQTKGEKVVVKTKGISTAPPAFDIQKSIQAMNWSPSPTGEEEGPRRSAFMPYKAMLKVLSSKSATVLTNLQRGNVQTPQELKKHEFSWFERAGRGSITESEIDEVPDIDTTDINGFTALMWSSAYGQIFTVKLLLRKGANVHIRANKSETAVHLAAAGGHHIILKHLIAHGASIDLLDDDGNSALIYAVHGDHHLSVHELLKHGATLFYPDCYNYAIVNDSPNSKLVIENHIFNLLTGKSSPSPSPQSSPPQALPSPTPSLPTSTPTSSIRSSSALSTSSESKSSLAPTPPSPSLTPPVKTPSPPPKTPDTPSPSISPSTRSPSLSPQLLSPSLSKSPSLSSSVTPTPSRSPSLSTPVSSPSPSPPLLHSPVQIMSPVRIISPESAHSDVIMESPASVLSDVVMESPVSTHSDVIMQSPVELLSPLTNRSERVVRSPVLFQSPVQMMSPTSAPSPMLAQSQLSGQSHARIQSSLSLLSQIQLQSRTSVNLPPDPEPSQEIASEIQKQSPQETKASPPVLSPRRLHPHIEIKSTKPLQIPLGPNSPSPLCSSSS